MEARGILRHGNLTQILRYVRDHGASSRHDIARGCGLGISTMTDLIGELRARRLVRELDPIRRPGAGRPTRPIAFDGEPWCVLGVHLDRRPDRRGGQHRRRPRAVDRDRRVDLRGAGPAGYAQHRRIASQATRIASRPTSTWWPSRSACRGYVAADRGDGQPADGLDWQDFELGTAVAADACARPASTHAFVGVSNECQLAALYASRIELPARPERHRRLPRRQPPLGSGADHPRRDLPRRRRRGRRLRSPQRGAGRTHLLVRPHRLPGVAGRSRRAAELDQPDARPTRPGTWSRLRPRARRSS